MPFTLSHPAAVLLVARTGLPVGAMVGVATVDVVLGVLGMLVWVHLVRDPLVDMAPPPVRERLASTARYSRRQWLLAPVAVAVGALTHVVWDSFTHRGRWGAQHVGWLGDMHAGLPGASWVQYLSGALGAVIVAVWATGFVMDRVRRERAPRLPELGVRALALVPVVSGMTTGVALLSRADDGLHAMAVSGAVWGTIAVVVTVVVLGMTWQLRARTGTRVTVDAADGYPR